ncbi:hypothetical protein TKK_0002874 [Trichogramma kaykai]
MTHQTIPQSVACEARPEVMVNTVDAKSKNDAGGNITHNDKDEGQKVTRDNDQEESNDFLALIINDDPQDEVEGESIKESIAAQWQKIVQTGLAKDAKLELLKKYPIPSNCPTLCHPELNDEFKAILGPGLKKDYYQTVTQYQLGVSIGILGTAMTEVIRTQTAKAMTGIFEPIKDACRLLTDMHYGISRTRRSFVEPSLNLKNKNIAKESPIDRRLYGGNFSALLKTAKDTEQTSKGMSKKASLPAQKDNNKQDGYTHIQKKYKSSTSLNRYGPPRKNQSGSSSRCEGFKIPFPKIPHQSQIPREEKLSAEELAEYQKVIKKLLDKGVIPLSKHENSDFISSYFLRKKLSGENRFIFNLKKLNAFIEIHHFKMETLKDVIRIVSKNDYMASIDLQDAFYLIPIHKKYKKYLKFSFEGEIYEYNCLPFGLSSSPYVFTKIIKHVIEQLRTRGYRSIEYLDDFLLVGETSLQCERNVQETRELLLKLGFIINEKKSVTTSSKQCIFLGCEIDTMDYCIRVTKSKIGIISESI